MAKHVLLVFTGPAEGREDDYNTWYNNWGLRSPSGVGRQTRRMSAVPERVRCCELDDVLLGFPEGPSSGVVALRLATPPT